MASSKKRRSGGLVWDSAVGSTCPTCARPLAQCNCAAATTPADPPTARTDRVVRVELDRKNRNGKVVTVIRGVPISADELRQLATDLKKLCGAGGKVADGCIEIQGDRRDAMLVELQRRGFTAKRAGG